MSNLWLLGFVLASAMIASAETSHSIGGRTERQSKYRMECALISDAFKKQPPTKPVSVWCANWGLRRDFGPMGHDVVHAMAAAAFFDKRFDHRQEAMKMLEIYECEDAEKCHEFSRLLEWGAKVAPNSQWGRRAEALLRKINLKTTPKP